MRQPPGQGDATETAPRSSSRYSIRRAAPDDARAIAETGVIGWRTAYRDLLPSAYLDGMAIDSREVAWRHLLEADADGRTPAWVGEEASGVVGFVSGGPPRDADVAPPAAEIYAIYLRPEARRNGLGTALMDAAVAHLRSAGATYLVLWVFEANAPARAFYEALGWVPDDGRQALLVGGVKAIEVRYRLADPWVTRA